METLSAQVNRLSPLSPQQPIRPPTSRRNRPSISRPVMYNGWKICSRSDWQRMIRSRPRAKRWTTRKSNWKHRKRSAQERESKPSARPFDGVVTGLMAVPGDKVQANNTIATHRQPHESHRATQSGTRGCSETGARRDRQTDQHLWRRCDRWQARTIGASVDPTTHLVKATLRCSCR